MLTWLRTLASIPGRADVTIGPCAVADHFFTDGSCLNQSFPSCRVASWAVVQADNQGFVHSQPIDSCPLPGILQSSYRAEIFALLRALIAARQCTGPVFLWSDCDTAVRKLRRLIRGFGLKINSSHNMAASDR